MINRLPKGLPVQNRNSARLLTSYPCKYPPRPALSRLCLCLCVARVTRVTARPTNEAARPVAIVAQLSTSHQCNLQLHFCKFASSTPLTAAKGHVTMSFKLEHQTAQKSCSCVCNAILFDLFENRKKNRIKNEILLFRLTFLGLRALVSNCQTIAPDYPVGRRLCAVSRLCLIGL